MAETFLTPVIDSLIKLLKDEVKSLKGIHREVESLKKELEIIQCLLKDADAKEDRGELSDAVRTWVKQLREEADRIEDVIDEYRWHVAQSTTDKRGFIGFLCKTGRRIKALKSCYPVSSQIHDINESLRRIKDIGQGYGLSQSLGLQDSSSKTSYTEEHDTRFGSHFVVEDEEYVDVPFVQEKLKRSLAEGGSTRSVISLVGQGGVGKTTLVKKVYNEVKHNFDCNVWITVSQSYDMEKTLAIMVKQINLTDESTTFHNDMAQGLITLLRKYLQTKRYVVVFDDVWDANFWEVMKHALPSNDKGSRIIFTTRITTVAAACKEAPYDFILELETWSPNMAWELFCKKTFRYEFDQSCCPKELEELSRKFVSKCQWLPLAIGAIAGLLSRKRMVPHEWQRVLSNLNLELKTNPLLTRISKILSLSYHDLPHHLKYCLLYFSIYPEDFLIPSALLYQLWIAEGFVKARESKKLVEEAAGYLNELITRNLVSLEIYDGVFTSCKVHDMMHEFILSKANDLCFCHILDRTNSEFGEDKHRRLSFRGRTLEAVTKRIKPFSGTKIKALPKSIGKLHNLQVLNLRHTLVSVLPKTIGKLHNLKSLDLLFTPVRELPLEINKLRNLREIFARCIKETATSHYIRGTLGVKIQLGFGYLENLETLTDVEAHLDGIGFMKELENLSKLKTLGVTNLTKESSRVVCAATKKLNHLQYLYLRTDSGDEILDVEPISSSPPPLMRTLFLSGRLNKFPHWISELLNLQGLNLSFSKLADNPLQYLKDLPNLICLRLINSYEGEQLHFEKGGFPKLNELWLRTLEGLKLLKIDRGTLPLLKILNIQSCPLLKEVPSGIQHLRILKELSVKNMPREFVDQLQSNGGPDYPKIQHVPIVRIE